MKTLDEVIKACEETVSDVDRGVDIEGCFLGATETRDALHYLKEFRVVTDICHKHGIASVWGQVLPDVEKTDWDKKLNLDNAFNNDPLTWDELKQMEGKPVWVECKYYSHQWAIIGEVTENRIRFYGPRLVDGEPQEEMGETWQAYRKER